MILTSTSTKHCKTQGKSGATDSESRTPGRADPMEGGEGNPPGKELDRKGFRNEVTGCLGSTRSEAKRLGGFKNLRI